MRITTIHWLIMCLALTAVQHASGSGDPHLYGTGRMMEVDRCASAWLIKRYVDPEARFIFFEDGELVTRGAAFDTPDSRFCRTHNRATFEILMAHHNIRDPRIQTLAKAIHEVEINYWAGKKSPLANELMMKINALIREHADPAECLASSFAVFDHALEKLSGSKGDKD